MPKKLLCMLILFVGLTAWPAGAKTIELTADSAADIVLSPEGDVFYVPADMAVELTGNISGSGPLVKAGPGALTLSGANTNATALIVKEGALVMAASQALSAGLRYIAVIGNGAPRSAVLELRDALYAGSLVIDIENGGVMQVGGNLQMGGRVQDSVGSISVRGPGSKLVCGQQVWIGDEGGYGELNIREGAAMEMTGANCNLYLGYQYGSRGVMRILGAGSVFRSANNAGLYAGYWGRGELYVDQGADMRVGGAVYGGFDDHSSALISISGPDSLFSSKHSLVLQGRDAAGFTELIVTDDAKLLCGGGVYIGSRTGRPRAMVESAVMMAVGEIGIGADGAGTLEVLEGGEVVSWFTINVGDNGDGLLSVWGEGARVYADNHLYLGYDGRARVDIGSSAEFFVNTSLDMGRSETARGELTLSGGAKLYTDYLNVGDGGYASLQVAEGGALRVNRQVWVGKQGPGSGRLELGENGALYGADVNIGVAGSLERPGESAVYQEVPPESMQTEFEAAKRWAFDLERELDARGLLPKP